MNELFLKIKIKKEKYPITAAAITVAVIVLFAALFELILSGARGGFSPLRWVLIALTAVTVYLFGRLGLRRCGYDPEKPLHIGVKLVTATVCVAMAFSFASVFGGGFDSVSYPLEGSITGYSPYVQQFDAFKKGQLHIDYQPSDALLELENPYDPAERKGVPYLWDRAFYNGQFYVYFGPAPIFTVYYPYYFVTGALPSDSFVLCVFMVMTALFFCLAVFRLAARYAPRAPLSLVSLSAVAGFLGTNVLMLSRGDKPFYYIATVAGIGFFCAFIYFFIAGLSAVERGAVARLGAAHSVKKYALLALAGLCFGGIFTSRTSIAVLAAFIVVPALIFKIVLQKRRVTGRGRVLAAGGELAALGLPVAAIMLATFAFNAARFGSPLEFGVTYQLTVSDISKNKLSLGDWFYALYHYFLQPLGASGELPYIGLSKVSLSYGRFVYVDPCFGLLSIPIAAVAVLSPVLCAVKRVPRYLKVQGLCILFGILAVALMDFCLAGVIFRYVCDLTAPAALLGVGAVLVFHHHLATSEPCREAWRAIYLSTVLILAASVTVCILLSLVQSSHLLPFSEQAKSLVTAIFGK